MKQFPCLAQVAVTLWERAKGEQSFQFFIQTARNSRRGKNIGLINCSSTFTAGTSFFVSWNSGFSSVGLEPAGPGWGSFKRFPFPVFLFCSGGRCKNGGDRYIFGKNNGKRRGWLRLAGVFYHTTQLCRVGHPLPRQPSSGLPQSSCYEVFLRPFCRNSCYLRQKCEKQHFSCFRNFCTNRRGYVAIVELSGWSEQRRATQMPGRRPRTSFLFFKKFVFFFL